MEQLITKLTAAQRMDMLQKGMSPLNAKEVRAYLQGYTISQKEKEQKAKALFEGLKGNLGSGSERDIIPQEGTDPDEFEKMMVGGRQPRYHTEQGMREQLDEDLSDYEVKQPIPSFSKKRQQEELGLTPRRQLLREVNSPNEDAQGEDYDNDGFVIIPKEPVATGDILHDGFEAAKNYLNSFVTNFIEGNMQNSYNSRKKMFDALQSCLQMEIRYKNNPMALKKFRAGVLKAEKAMFQKLQGKMK